MLMKWGQSFAEPRRGICGSRGPWEAASALARYSKSILPLQTVYLLLLTALLPVSVDLVREKLDQRSHFAAAN